MFLWCLSLCLALGGGGRRGCASSWSTSCAPSWLLLAPPVFSSQLVIAIYIYIAHCIWATSGELSSSSLHPMSRGVGCALKSLWAPGTGQKIQHHTEHFDGGIRVGKSSVQWSITVGSISLGWNYFSTIPLSDCNLERKKTRRSTTQWRRHLMNHQWLLRVLVHLLICTKVWPTAITADVGSLFLCVRVCIPEGL